MTKILFPAVSVALLVTVLFEAVIVAIDVQEINSRLSAIETQLRSPSAATLVTREPFGNCKIGQMQFNVETGKLWGCMSGKRYWQTK